MTHSYTVTKRPVKRKARESKSSGRTFGIGLQLSIDSIAEELLKLPP